MNTDNIWPYSIIAFFTVAICTFVSYAVFTARHSVDLVSEDYYERELAYQDRIDSRQRALDLAERPAWEHQDPARQLVLKFPNEQAVRLQQGELIFYRASDKDLDRRVPLALDANGSQAIATAAMPAGLWQLQLHWTMDGEAYYLEEALILP